MDSLDNQFPTDQHVGQQPLPAPPAPPAITPAMMGYLKQTKPWVRFLSIMGFIGTGLLFLVGLLLIFGAGILARFTSTAIGGLPLVLAGCLYAALGCVCFFPALYLFRFADAIQKALIRDQVGGMEEALKHQKSYWTFMGILVLIILIIQIVALMLVVLAAIVGLIGMSGRL